MGGASLAYSIAPALCTAGFCQAGVTQSSFAAWWQSTMPLISGGSLFAILQSIAMGGVGTNVVVSGSVLGSTVAMVYVPQLCAYVDDPDSSMAPVFDANLAAVKNAKLATDKVKNACSSSETCSAATETLSSSASSMWSYISDSASQTIRAGKIWGLEAIVKGDKERIQRYKDENRSRHEIEKAEKELKNDEARLHRLKQEVALRALEVDVDNLKEKIERMKQDNYSGQFIEQVRHSSWARAVVNWLSEGVVESIFDLEKELVDKEARVLQLKEEAV